MLQQARKREKRSYEQRIRDVEHASFTPLVLSTMGGMGREATAFYKRLASLLASKWDTPYCRTLNWLRCRLSFSLLRSAIQAVRGARSSVGRAVITTSVDPELAVVESKLHWITLWNTCSYPCVYELLIFIYFLFLFVHIHSDSREFCDVIITYLPFSMTYYVCVYAFPIPPPPLLSMVARTSYAGARLDTDTQTVTTVTLVRRAFHIILILQLSVRASVRMSGKITGSSSQKPCFLRLSELWRYRSSRSKQLATAQYATVKGRSTCKAYTTEFGSRRWCCTGVSDSILSLGSLTSALWTKLLND